MRSNSVLAALTLLLPACLAYQPPSGRGYDYDRGRTLALSDVRSDRLVYLVTGDDADSLAALSRAVEQNCGFTIQPAYSDADSSQRDVDFAQGYNSVSVPVIEERLGSGIRELMQSCAVGEIGGD